MLEQLDKDGFVTVPSVLSPAQVEEMLSKLESAIAADAAGSTLRSDGTIYAARNVMKLWPDVVTAWRRPPLPDMLTAALGPEHGLVRVLYFDKPPGQSWALPWHKDAAIAVKNNRLPSRHFSKPTTKAGVPHVEAPAALLDRMLTARIHLDDVTEENGPLKVIPGSHRGVETREPVTIFARAGDVLLMRPLLSHGSNRSQPGTERHRRILHFEFAASPDLPDGYEWHDFT